MLEYFNQIYLIMLSMFMNDRIYNWDVLLPFVIHAYFTCIHESTGFLPFREMMRESCSLLANVSMPELRAYILLHTHSHIGSGMHVIMFRGSILVSKLLKQGYSSRKLQATFRKFYGRHTDLVHQFDTSVSHMLNGLFTNSNI